MKTVIITIAMLIAAANLSAGEPLDTLWTMKTNLSGYAGAKFVHNDTKILLAYGGKFFEIDALTGDTLRMSEQFGKIYSFDCINNLNTIVSYIEGLGSSVLDYNTFQIKGKLKGTGYNHSINSTNNLIAGPHHLLDSEGIVVKLGIIISNINTLDSINFIETRIAQNYYASANKLQFSPDGRFLITILREYQAGDKGYVVVRVYDGNTFQFIKDIIIEQRELGNSELNFSQDGTLLCVTIFNTINIFNTQTWEKIAEINPSMTKYPNIHKCDLINNNERVIIWTGGQYPVTQIWDLNPIKMKYQFQDMAVIAVSLNNKYILSIFKTLFMINAETLLSSISTPLPQSYSLYYNNGFSLSSTQEILSPPMIEVFNVNGGIVLPLSQMMPIGGVYKNNTSIPHGLYLIKLHINNQVYNTNIIVE